MQQGKKTAALVAALVVTGLVALAGLSAEQAYDRGAVVKVMRQNSVLMQQLKDLVFKESWKDAGAKFEEFAKMNRDLTAMNPPRGSKAEWDKAYNELADAALRGASAAGKSDKAGAEAALSEMGRFMMTGHRAFR